MKSLKAKDEVSVVKPLYFSFPPMAIGQSFLFRNFHTANYHINQFALVVFSRFCL